MTTPTVRLTLLLLVLAVTVLFCLLAGVAAGLLARHPEPAMPPLCCVPGLPRRQRHTGACRPDPGCHSCLSGCLPPRTMAWPRVMSGNPAGGRPGTRPLGRACNDL